MSVTYDGALTCGCKVVTVIGVDAPKCGVEEQYG